ncbi:hypothetical protein FACS1894184_20920 [Clostridia bacterium]|nr:hypothetical protein FACS1894184_20920 [Clostridia bacterium]
MTKDIYQVNWDGIEELRELRYALNEAIEMSDDWGLYGAQGMEDDLIEVEMIIERLEDEEGDALEDALGPLPT